jgi:hypothetical protein
MQVYDVSSHGSSSRLKPVRRRSVDPVDLDSFGVGAGVVAGLVGERVEALPCPTVERRDAGAHEVNALGARHAGSRS